MGRRDSAASRRPAGQRGRDLAKAIKAAGGELTLTARGHFRVVGPGGIAVVAASGNDKRSLANAVRDIKVHAGLVVVV